ncbi:MAG: thioredoxin domain-containing protein [Sphingobacteriaceae bacterium]|nr:thioredoxin domain-containing protein [Sphingobacteriaceae bacterium]
MNLFKTQQRNLVTIANDLLRHLGVKVTSLTVKNCIQNHTEYPSILALSDCLDNWNVKNDAFKIDIPDYDREDLLFPFTAHFPEQGGRFVLVHSIEEGNVCYSDEHHKKALMNEGIFLKRWDGIALYAEKRDLSGESGYMIQYVFGILQKVLYPVTFVLGVLSIGLIITSHPFSEPYIAICLVKFIGSTISILLLIQSLNPKNSFIKNLCSLGGKGGCDTVLKSKYAQLTPWLSWSEVGLYYFVGSFLLLLIYPLSMGFLAWLNILTLPYTMWSLHYQFRNRKWCILCCAILIALWAELLINVSFDSFSFQFESAMLYILPISFCTPIVIWALLQRLLKHAITPLKQQISKIKYNTTLFQNLLTNQPRYAVSDELFPILLGNPTASTVITIVSNPYCDPCAKAHAVIGDLLETKRDILVKVLFSTPDRDDDFRTKAARHLSILTLSNDKELAGKALTSWYTKKDSYENWSVEYPIVNNHDNYDATKKQREWCERADITFTPTILINGYKLPNVYSPEDLKHLLN